MLKKQEMQKENQKKAEMKLKTQMQAYIDSSKTDREQERMERKEVTNFMNQPDVKKVFDDYQKQLSQLYYFYAKQDNAKYGGIPPYITPPPGYKKDKQTFEIEYLHSMLSFRELVRFGYQQNVTPHLITPEDLVYIFKNLIREEKEKTDDPYMQASATMIDYEAFKKAIVRIVAMAQERLNAAGKPDKDDKLVAKLKEQASKAKSGGWFSSKKAPEPKV